MRGLLLILALSLSSVASAQFEQVAPEELVSSLTARVSAFYGAFQAGQFFRPPQGAPRFTFNQFGASAGGRLQPTPEARALLPDVAEIFGRLGAVAASLWQYHRRETPGRGRTLLALLRAAVRLASISPPRPRGTNTPFSSPTVLMVAGATSHGREVDEARAQAASSSTPSTTMDCGRRSTQSDGRPSSGDSGARAA